ncbi:MAG: hypothetical protein HOM04_05800 [Euryarchaeota archaeon]|nr:hypothetical protein [Euryarchaeota archaeon]
MNENLQIRIETVLQGADVPKRVEASLLALFPEFPVPTHPGEPKLGQASDTVWRAEGVPLGAFLKLLHEQRILDTALDSMTAAFDGTKTHFALLRQAAIVGKVAFPLPGEHHLEESLQYTLKVKIWVIGLRLQHGIKGATLYHEASRMKMQWEQMVKQSLGFSKVSSFPHPMNNLFITPQPIKC